MEPLLQILQRLNDQGVEYVLVGGMAAVALGSPVVTQDVDVCAPLDERNLTKIVAALSGIHPRLRMRPDKMPIPENLPQLTNLRNLNLITDLGVIDFLSELTEVGNYAAIAHRTVELNLGGVKCRVLDLETLIASKRAAGRYKDQLNVWHLEVIRELKRQQPGLFDQLSEDE
ncbi:MAG TPA: hypothetical protein VFE58_07335 [Tepidisphaeraceae bacterium]|jgi:predicted nucleotidyltransferase|nr:hypothetical protein [Tepidisphaeraceae bacterium]